MSARQWLGSLAVAAALGALASFAAIAEDNVATLRGLPIAEEADPPPLGNPSNKDLRRVRNYPEQPPTIPHKVRGYQVDLQVNRCLTCHGRRQVGQSQAPMVSVTHFMDREGQMRAFVSPRRYFCYQCHVPQEELQLPVENTFTDVDDLVRGAGKAEGG